MIDALTLSRKRFAGTMPGGLLRNLGAYGMAEIVARITRLATTVVLARLMTPAEFGVAATALTGFELLRTLANNGIGQAVIRAPAEKLQDTCRSAWRAGWRVCLGVAALQVAVAAVLLTLPGWETAGWMLGSLAGVYLAMPPGLVNVYLLQREGQARDIAVVATAQVIADNLLTLLLALAGLGAWAIVLPKLMTAPIWLLGMRMRNPWRHDGGPGVPLAGLMRGAVPVLGSEVLATLRLNLDKLLVGALLGVEALGLYYFIFNAGIGISLSLTGALSMAVLPYIAAGGTRIAMLARFDRALVAAVVPIGLIIALQAAASPFYVPLVFGERWAAVAPLVALLCASAIAKPAADAAAQLLRAAGKPRRELAFWALFTVAYLASFAAALPFGLPAAILMLCVVATVLQLGFAAAARAAVARATFA